jgi:hypothetical protein
MGGLALSTLLTTVLLPTTATLAEDGFGWIGRKLRAAWERIGLPRWREAAGD